MKQLQYVALILGLAVSTASEALDVKTTCPLTVKVGTALKVTERIYNDDCSATKTVSKVIAALVGNGGGSIGLQGPFVTPLSPAKVVPKATCNSYPPKSGVVALTVTVVASTPTTLKNTLALVSGGAMESGGSISMSKPCTVTVVP